LARTAQGGESAYIRGTAASDIKKKEVKSLQERGKDKKKQAVGFREGLIGERHGGGAFWREKRPRESEQEGGPRKKKGESHGDAVFEIGGRALQGRNFKELGRKKEGEISIRKIRPGNRI